MWRYPRQVFRMGICRSGLGGSWSVGGGGKKGGKLGVGDGEGGTDLLTVRFSGSAILRGSLVRRTRPYKLCVRIRKPEANLTFSEFDA